MKVAKIVILVALFALVARCASSSISYNHDGSIGFKEDTSTDGTVVIKFYNQDKEYLSSIDTRASIYHKYKLYWVGEFVILESSDIGIDAYKCDDKEIFSGPCRKLRDADSGIIAYCIFANPSGRKNGHEIFAEVKIYVTTNGKTIGAGRVQGEYDYYGANIRLNNGACLITDISGKDAKIEYSKVSN